MTLKKLNILSIRIDGDTQSRVAIDNDVVAEYAEAIKADAKFPPVTVFFDGTDYWLADGFHRFHAHRTAEKTSIEAEVRTGTQRDAILFSLGANNLHGLRPNSEDKRKAVTRMLADPEWSRKTTRDIALHCGCSHTTVVRLRNPPEPVAPKSPESGTSSKPPGAGTPTGGTKGEPKTPSSPKKEAPPPIEAEQQAAQAAQDAHGDTDLMMLVDEQAEQIKVLQAQVAAAMADDPKAEAMKYQRIAAIATTRQNEMMARVNEREEEIKRHVNTLRRIGRAVGEEDPARVAATVEAFVRNMGKVAA